MSRRKEMPSGRYYVCDGCGGYTSVPDDDGADAAVTEKGWELPAGGGCFCPACRKEPIEPPPQIVDVPLPFGDA